MSDKTCNGWSNWATWNCNLWFDDWTDRAIECIKDAFDPNDPDNLDHATKGLATIIEQDVTDFAPEVPQGLFRDLLSNAMNDINYYEIAEHYISDNAKEVIAELMEDEG
jgi:hypothetical protein